MNGLTWGKKIEQINQSNFKTLLVQTCFLIYYFSPKYLVEPYDSWLETLLCQLLISAKNWTNI